MLQTLTTKNCKTPLKTPLKLSSSTKKTPHTKINDRYIPNRVCSSIEASYHLLTNSKDQENIENQHQQSDQIDTIKRKLLKDTCNGALNEKETKVLNLHSRQNDSDQSFSDNIKILYSAGSATNSVKKTNTRHVISAPEKVLDAPDFRDDFCKPKTQLYSKSPKII